MIRMQPGVYAFKASETSYVRCAFTELIGYLVAQNHRWDDHGHVIWECSCHH